jgi:nicotinamidase-related amidase
VDLTTSGGDGQNGPFMGELRAMFPKNEVVDRTLINAWDDPSFVNAVKKTGRKKLLMAGITTDVYLTFPALQAVAEGFDVYAILDASGTWNSLIEQAAMMRMAQAGVKLTTWVAVSAELQRDWATPTGPSLGRLYFDRLAPYSFLLESHNRQAWSTDL